MSKSTLMRYSTVILVILLSFLIFWHVNSDKNTSQTQALNPLHHDAYMIGAHYHSTDSKGNLHEQLTAQSAKHYPYQNKFEFTAPELKIFGPNGETWHIRAGRGSSTHGTDTVVLNDNVHIEHRVNHNAPTVVVTTDKLIVHPDQRTADSDSLVTITYPQVVLRGQGLHGDMKAGTLKLMTQIRGHYEPLVQTPQHTPIAQSEPKLRTAL